MRAVIVSGFPGVGKSYAYEHVDDLAISDSDSSAFSWTSPGVRNPAFPQNYIDHIKTCVDKYDIVFVSSHKAVRDALVDNSLPFTIVYPHRDLKEEYLERYRVRGSDKVFVNMMDENWDKFVGELDEIRFYMTHRTPIKLVRLYKGQFLNIRRDILKFMRDA